MEIQPRKTLLILKAQSQTLGPVEGFLTHRGWVVKITCDIKDAMLYLTKQQPEYFMISIDHPQAQRLPRAVAQALPVCVIAFAENNSIDSLNRLNQSGTPHTIPAPVTGPAVERAINKILMSRSGPAKGTFGGHWRTFNNATSPSTIAIRSGGPSQNQFEQFLSQFFDGPTGWTPQDPIPSKKALSLQDSLISKCARQALYMTCKEHNGKTSQSVGTVSHAYCVVIHSPRFSGYLLITCPAGAFTQRGLLTKIHHDFLHVMKESGEPAIRHESLQIRVNKVHFTSWALSDADFIHSADHQNHEISMAFFQRLDLHVIEEKNESPMLSIHLDEVEENTVLHFNLYIHLEKNQKFLRYVRRGLTLATEQKQRLMKQGLSRFHILQMEAEAFHHYRVERFINKKIDSYHQQR